ncbi:dolichol kinase [Sporobolomyces koalae]|uniref:dolichol kinase n=1 Tax=Sporobolomyces koalae TaxID=500713 RepID=UPI00317BF22A
MLLSVRPREQFPDTSIETPRRATGEIVPPLQLSSAPISGPPTVEFVVASPTILVTSPSRRLSSPAPSRSQPASSPVPRVPRSPTRLQFGPPTARPPLRGRAGRGNGAESYYMASASGSQTEAGDGADIESSSDSELDDEILHARIFGPAASTTDRIMDFDPRVDPGSGAFRNPSRDQGRGGHVLVEKRSLSPSSMKDRVTAAAEPRRERSWGSALLDTLEGNNHGHRGKRRPSSPSVNIPRYPRASPRGRTNRTNNDSPPREESPPLTLDSLNSSYNPFSLFHIRTHLIFEVVVLLLPFLFAIYRLYAMLPTSLFPSIPFIPFRSLLVLAASIPFIALFRRESHYFQAPFTDERGYRDSKQADDGVASALVLPILLASAVWWDTYSNADGHGRGVGLEGIKPLIEVWEANGIRAVPMPETPVTFDPSSHFDPIERARALFQARHQLVLLTSLNAVCLLVHLVMSRTVLQVEKLPRSNTKRFFGFMAVATGVSTAVWAVLSIWGWLRGETLSISPLEAAISTYIQQSSFYIVSRLARRGFTLGELNTMTAAGNALCLEFWRLTRARWLYKRGFPYIPPTFRSPTPVIAFQTVLIPGAFFAGFLLSPLLVLSRHIASKPSHRLKWPTERQRHRKLLALGILVGLSVIVFLFLGAWIGWMLSATSRLRQPWTWAARFLYLGASDGVLDRSPSDAGWTKRWKRLGLVAYWAGTIVVAVGGWQTHLVRARRIRLGSRSNANADKRDKKERDLRGSQAKRDKDSFATGVATGASGTVGSAPGGGLKLLGMVGSKKDGNENSHQAGNASSRGAKGDPVAVGRVGAESARETRAVHASLNMRRKFFHALAVFLFVPGIAIDPPFTSLAFSVAFALFTFAEYARFFAVYPIGGPLHIFFTEFIDSKDGGPVILSHFYLLTGCAGGLWLEGKGINRFTGVLVLGIGDSLASIVGKLTGCVRWPGTSKTVEGTAAFVLSIMVSACFLRLAGLVEPFSLGRYFLAVVLSALYEAASAQNDNLVIPIYMWSVVSLLNV